MPTGYTAGVADGSVTEFEPFIWQLARGMGALVTMRDDHWDAPVPEAFEPSAYSADRLAELRTERERLYALSDAEAQAEADQEHSAYLAARGKYFADNAARRDRYEAMIAKVKAWTAAPEGIKEFALEQLERGLEFDCPTDPRYYREEPTRDGAEWKRGKLAKVGKSVEYHAEQDAKERARTEGRNAWLRQLRRSLEAARQTEASGNAG